MIKDIKVYGLDEVLEARRSFNSQVKSDSVVGYDVSSKYNDMIVYPRVIFGPNDLKLLSNLKNNGDSHGKVCRFVTVFLTLTLPRRMWVDFDTYRLGREEIRPDDFEIMSDSTMHTLGRGYTTKEDYDDSTDQRAIDLVNEKIRAYMDRGKTDEDFIKLKSNLPEGFLQTRRLKLNYQSLRHIWKDRHAHRQPEFRNFCIMIECLPYAKEFIL